MISIAGGDEKEEEAFHSVVMRDVDGKNHSATSSQEEVERREEREENTNHRKRKSKQASGFPLLLPPPSPLTQTLIRQVLASGLIEHVAKRPNPSLSAALCAAARVPIDSGWTPYLPASLSVIAGIAAGCAAAQTSAALNSAQGGRAGEKAALDSSARSLALQAAGSGWGAAGDTLENEGGRRNTTPPCVWVHPHSSVHSHDTSLMPSFLVFSSISFGKAGRAYARGVTAIDEAWLPSLAGGTPLLKWSPPLPGTCYYDFSRDAVCATCTPIFGDSEWRLKPISRPLLPRDASSTRPHAKEDSDTALRVFARAMLEGVAVKGLGAWTSHLAAPPSSITKHSPSRRVLQLLAALTSSKEHTRQGIHDGGCELPRAVMCRRDLASVWRVSPGYLFGEVQAWVKEGEALRFSSCWPSIVRDFLEGEK